MAANPLRKVEPKTEYDLPPRQPRDDPARTEWPLSEPGAGSSAPFGWAGYMIGAAVLVIALIAALYFGFSAKTSNEVAAPSGSIQTIPGEATPPTANEQQKSAPGAATGAPQTTQPQNTVP